MTGLLGEEPDRAAEPAPRRGRDPLVMGALCAVTWLALIAILVGWLRHVPQEVVRQLQLPRLSMIALETGFALLLLTAVAAARPIAALFRQVPRRVLWAAAGIAVGAFALTHWVAPREYRIFYDEHIYLNIGQSMAFERTATSCDDGRAEYGEYRVVDGAYNKQPNGYPYLVSLMFRLFGVSEWRGMQLNNALFALSTALVFALGWVVFEDWSVALLAAVAQALTPQTILWSNTAAAEPATMTFAVLAILAVAAFARARTTSTLCFAVAALAFGIQFRPESMFLLPVAFLLILAMAPGELVKPRTYWAGAALIALLLVHFAHLWVVRGEDWGAESTSARFGWEILRTTAGTNLGYLVTNREFPVLFTVCALLGLGVRTAGLRKAAVATWFLLTFGIFLFFYAGSFGYGNDDRFALVSAAPLALLTGWGAAWLVAGLDRVGMSRAGATALGAAVLFGGFTQVSHRVRAIEEEAWEARADVNVAREFAAELPPNSIVLTHNPNMFLLWGCNAAQLYFVDSDPGRIEWYLERFTGGVYFHYNYWCNVADTHLDSLCNEICKRFECETIDERLERDYRYAMIRLHGLRPEPPTEIEVERPPDPVPDEAGE